MSSKRELAGGPSWGIDRALRAAAAELLDVDDGTIAAEAEELGADARRLKAFVEDARGRRARADGS